MRIDVHAHYWTEDYLDLLVDLGKTGTSIARGRGAGGGAELEARLRLMDRAGVQMQVLSASPQLPYAEDREKAANAGIDFPYENGDTFLRAVCRRGDVRPASVRSPRRHRITAISATEQRGTDLPRTVVAT